ncbi:MAG: RHS repeat-associated core domain-containing protein [Bacteroidota bacterium]
MSIDFDALCSSSYKSQLFVRITGFCTLKADNTFQYEYTLKDHLGNNRVTFADSNNDGNATESEILQESHYYPFGLTFDRLSVTNSGTRNDYMYNGKELNADFRLGWSDYGARMYDATIGRWNAVDPLAEKYYPISPYAYVANNPIVLIDPDGKQIDISQALQYDRENKTEYVETIISELQEQTGLSITYDENSGILSYEKPEGKLSGSKRARKMLMKAIDHKETVKLKLRETGGSNVPRESKNKERQNELNLDVNQISSFRYSEDLNEATYGFGMHFLHELGHTRVGGRKLDGGKIPGSNVRNMNKIRKQLGEDYGKRMNYLYYNVTNDLDYIYMAWSSRTLSELKSGLENPPTGGWVKFPRKKSNIR